MIVQISSGERMTPDQVARELVWMFGNQLTGMGSDEWDHVCDPQKLTDREADAISRLIYKHERRVHKLLRIGGAE